MLRILFMLLLNCILMSGFSERWCQDGYLNVTFSQRTMQYYESLNYEYLSIKISNRDIIELQTKVWRSPKIGFCVKNGENIVIRAKKMKQSTQAIILQRGNSVAAALSKQNVGMVQVCQAVGYEMHYTEKKYISTHAYVLDIYSGVNGEQIADSYNKVIPENENMVSTFVGPDLLRDQSSCCVIL